MKKYLVYFSLIIAAVLLVGCGKKDNDIVGVWSGAENDELEAVFNFKSNGEMTYKNAFVTESNGTYEIKDDTITMTVEVWSQSKVYKFEVKDDKLTLTAQDDFSPSYKNLSREKS